MFGIIVGYIMTIWSKVNFKIARFLQCLLTGLEEKVLGAWISKCHC
jgi:hypothetical protein